MLCNRGCLSWQSASVFFILAFVSSAGTRHRSKLCTAPPSIAGESRTLNFTAFLCSIQVKMLALVSGGGRRHRNRPRTAPLSNAGGATPRAAASASRSGCCEAAICEICPARVSAVNLVQDQYFQTSLLIILLFKMVS